MKGFVASGNSISQLIKHQSEARQLAQNDAMWFNAKG